MEKGSPLCPLVLKSCTKPSYPPHKNKNLSKFTIRSWRHRRKVSGPESTFWVSSHLSQCNFSMCYLKHIASQPIYNCPEKNSLEISFKRTSQSNLMHHHGNKTLPSFTFESVPIIWKKEIVKSSASAFWTEFRNTFISHLQRSLTFFLWSHCLILFRHIWGIPSVYVSNKQVKQKMEEKNQRWKQSLENVWEVLRKHTCIRIF